VVFFFRTLEGEGGEVPERVGRRRWGIRLTLLNGGEKKAGFRVVQLQGQLGLGKSRKGGIGFRAGGESWGGVRGAGGV